MLSALTAFRHCLLTCPEHAYIVALILIGSVRTLPNRQTDGPPVVATAIVAYLQRRSRFLHVGQDDVHQVLMDRASGHALTSAGRISRLKTDSGYGAVLKLC